MNSQQCGKIGIWLKIKNSKKEFFPKNFDSDNVTSSQRPYAIVGVNIIQFTYIRIFSIGSGLRSIFEVTSDPRGQSSVIVKIFCGMFQPAISGFESIFTIESKGSAAIVCQTAVHATFLIIGCKVPEVISKKIFFIPKSKLGWRWAYRIFKKIPFIIYSK